MTEDKKVQRRTDKEIYRLAKAVGRKRAPHVNRGIRAKGFSAIESGLFFGERLVDPTEEKVFE